MAYAVTDAAVTIEPASIILDLVHSIPLEQKRYILSQVLLADCRLKLSKLFQLLVLIRLVFFHFFLPNMNLS